MLFDKQSLLTKQSVRYKPNQSQFRCVILFSHFVRHNSDDSCMAEGGGRCSHCMILLYVAGVRSGSAPHFGPARRTPRELAMSADYRMVAQPDHAPEMRAFGIYLS